tara:strand:- start:859 stop:1236 length:378 start_codon:yes stop_codon:yes gene_type:complete
LDSNKTPIIEQRAPADTGATILSPSHGLPFVTVDKGVLDHSLDGLSTPNDLPRGQSTKGPALRRPLDPPNYFLRSDQVHASSQATDGRSKKSTLDISLIAVPEWVNPILPTAPLKRHRPAFPSFE